MYPDKIRDTNLKYLIFKDRCIPLDLDFQILKNTLGQYFF